MSKLAAIDCAVRLQLASDGKGAIDYKKLMGGSTSGTNPGYAYDQSAMQSFLLAVANRLKLDVPAFSFAWQSIPPANCLTANLEVLIQYIATATMTDDN